MSKKCYLIATEPSGIVRKCRLIANNIRRSLITNRLPYEYQEVEWIEGDSTNFYLNTGVKMDLTKETYVEGKFLIPAGGNRRYIFGSYSGTYNVNIEIRTDNRLRLYMGADRSVSADSISINTPEISTFSYNPFTNTATTTYGQIIASDVYDYKGEHPNNVSLFTDTRKSDSPFTGIRVYYYKHIENGNEKCHLIPCYRKSDNVIGMYDLVSKSFKINELTGTFTKGNDVN